MIPAPLPASSCLFLDVDGTLIDIAATPDRVVVAPGLVDDLRRLETMFGGAVALVSGRSITDLDRLFAPLRLTCSGVHGAEFRFPGDDDRLGTAVPLPENLWIDLQSLLQAFPLSLAENKGFSFAVHYRAAPETGPRLRAALERFLAARTDLDLALLPGHFVYELKRPDIHKGGAIAALMARPPFAGRRPTYVGDDVTDVPAFAAVLALGGFAYSVREPFASVTGTFADPAAVRQWLAGIAAETAFTG